MNAGKMRRRIVIQQKTIGKDAAGYPVETWADVFNPFVARKPIPRGKETFTAEAVQSENMIRYEMRYRPGITPDMRLVDRGRIYQIVFVMDDVKGDGTETHLITKEFVNG